MSGRVDLLIIAHRGASADHPENTEDALFGAASQGADWVEIDVRRSHDGCLIVNHDPWYHDERTVWDTSGSDRPPYVLELSEALDICASTPRPLGVNVEIKNSPGDLGGDHVPVSLQVVDEVVALLCDRAGAGVREEILLSSFDTATIDRVRELGGPPTAQLVLDLAAWPDAIESIARHGHVALHPWDPFVDADLLDRAHAAGLAVNTWTVDDPERITALAAMGVDGIVTNVPATARRAAQLGDGG